MSWAVLFQFHRAPERCAERLAALRGLNPGVPVFAAYGGPAAEWRERAAPLETLVDGLWLVPDDLDARWKWANTDLVARRWYQDVGCRHAFDRLVHVQWDLVLAAPLGDAYAGVPAGAVGLTGPVPLDAIRDRWSWTTAPELLAGTRALLDDLVVRRGLRGPYVVSLGPGPCLPRAFLERYAAEDVSEAGHDEIRLPAYARLLGFDVADTGFYAWFDAGTERVFHANDEEIGVEEALAAAQRGRVAFHPCRERFGAGEIAALAAAVRRASPPPRA